MKFLKILPFVLSSALIFSSCDDDDNHHVQVPAAVQNSFGQRYPDANAVEWENENYGVGRLLKAEFMENGVEVEAWFNYDGTWVKSERDFRGTLPQAVTDYIAGHYPGFRTDDVNWVETPKGNFYEVELEKGKHEVELSIAEDGTVVFIQDNQQAVPTAVSDSFAERFPGITPSKWETEGWLLKAEFRLQNAEAEA